MLSEIYTQKIVEQKLHTAYDRLIQHDYYLLEHDVGERSIVSKLAWYLQTEFLDMDVDVEYNRDGNDPKRVSTTLVVPDIIIHMRGSRDSNLVALEVKKKDSPHVNRDIEKLRGYLDQIYYQYAYTIVIDRSDPIQQVKTNLRESGEIYANL